MAANMKKEAGTSSESDGQNPDAYTRRPSVSCIFLHLTQFLLPFLNPSHPLSLHPLEISASLQEINTANNLWCLSKEVRSGDLQASGTFFSPAFSSAALPKEHSDMQSLAGATADRQTHVHAAHLFSCSWPKIDCRAAKERLLYNRWFSLRSWDETLCVTSALWSFLRLQSVQAPLLGFVPMRWGQMSA